MKPYRLISIISLSLLLFLSCSKDVNINDDWTEIMVVYGLLDPNDSVQYIKVTKAFLGPGNALQYAQIPDSSNMAGRLRVNMDEYDGGSLINSMTLDTAMIANKDSGIFYFPQQLVYVARGPLNVDHQYRISILDTVTGVEVKSSTYLVHGFNIKSPNSFSKASFVQGSLTTAEWTSAKYGKRYQLNIRFSYWEINKLDTANRVKKTVNWMVFNDLKSKTILGGDQMENSFYGDGFFFAIKAQVPPKTDPNIERRPIDSVEFIFTVASEELSNYIEVTDPSNTIVQEKPIYTNIENGIGLFSSRTDNTVFNPRKLLLSDRTKDSLNNGTITGNLWY